MVDENKFEQYGFPRDTADIQGITLHESSDITDTANDLHEWYNSVNKSNNAFHYIVDDSGYVQLMPDNYAVYHTGKNSDWGDRYTIAIELCTTLSDDKFQSTIQNTIALIQSLQEIYNISDNMIFFHNIFNERVYCPKTLLDRYGSAKQFVMEELKGV